ncbi:TolC family protein [Flagellimonas meridianipacifica]|uniref:Outer membrane protein TolC n=1 Tax=Flagellimonas meridianipacifica TaxID=1080225 RepID=A0A2T0MGX1_9FLAO|nr:TolC family protein [Allomuricauda pacifica]PRX56827.1 outer membrane protein TolC [Allomuricauda pacifica]
MKFKIYISVVFFILAAKMFSQKAWTLDECVSYAVENNLQVKNLSYTKDNNRESYRQSVRNLLPNFSGFSQYRYNTGLNEDPSTGVFVNQEFNSFNYSVNANLDIFQGFQKLNSIKAAKFIYEAAKEDVLQEKFLLAFRVMSAYYDIKFNEGLVANSLEQQDISQTNYDMVQRQVELGVMAEADLVEAESNLLSDKLLVTQNRNLLALSKLTLLQEMNLTEESDIELQIEEASENDVEGSGTVEVDSLYTAAKGFIPVIKSQEYLVKAAKKQLNATRGNLYPSLSMIAGLESRYSETTLDDNDVPVPFSDQLNDNFSRFIGAQIIVPITNGWSSRSQVKQQKIALLQAENNLDIQEQALFQLVQQLVQTNNALVAEYEQSNKRVESQGLAFQIAQKRYEKGLINALELFQAKNLYGTAQNENLQVRLRLKVNESTIDFYSGLPIFNIN